MRTWSSLFNLRTYPRPILICQYYRSYKYFFRIELDLQVHQYDHPGTERRRIVRISGLRTARISPKKFCKSEDDVQNPLKRLWQDEQGQDLVEYALLLVLIALAAAATLQTVGASIVNVFSNANTALTSYTT
jgi:pilus assembly protein Flp/PilA